MSPHTNIRQLRARGIPCQRIYFRDFSHFLWYFCGTSITSSDFFFEKNVLTKRSILNLLSMNEYDFHIFLFFEGNV